jgi:pyruvyltransferase
MNLIERVFSNKWLLAAAVHIMMFASYAEEILPNEGLPLFYWNEKWRGRTFVNFGDYISLKLVERIVGGPVRSYIKGQKFIEKKMLATGSIISFAIDGDIVWGSGINGKLLKAKDYKFKSLDIRCVRGPLTRNFLREHLHHDCPEIYGDPALLFPYFFPEFKRSENPSYDYILIPHFSEEDDFLKEEWANVVYSTDPWEEVIAKILDSRFVISSSLHGVLIAEAYGIPARLLRVSDNEPLFKYQDYYLGTGRSHFRYASTVDEALEMGGEDPPQCDLGKVYRAFPFEYWPHAQFSFPQPLMK